MNRSNGSRNENRRAQAGAALLSMALTFIFVAYLFRRLASIEDFDLSVPILFGGVALSVSLFFLTRDQITARNKAEAALKEALNDKALLKETIETLQSGAKTGNTEIMMARAVELQAKLRNSEALHQSLVETLPFFIFRKDAEGRFMFVNERFCKHFNLTKDQIIGKTDLDLFPEDFAAKYRRDDMLVRQSEQNLDVVETHQSNDGSTQYVHVVKSPIYDAENKLIGVQGVFWDVTERRRAEEKLAAEKERLHVTLRSIGDGVISTDINGHVTLMNQVAEELTGWSHAEAKGKPLADIFKCLDVRKRQPIPCSIGAVLDTGQRVETTEHQVLLSREGTECLIEGRCAAMRDRQRQIIGAVLVFQNITDRLQLESEAAKSSRIESIGLLAGGIAHDFNNILTAIIGNLSLVKYATKLPPEVIGRFDLVEKAALRARDLTQQLLTFAKGGAPVRHTASLIEIIRESADFALRGSKVRAEFNLATDLAPADVDASQIHQVIHNLVLNAVQAMPDGGLVRVEAQNHRLISRAEAPLPPGDYIRICVRDQGPGITPDLLPKIFDPYFTTKHGGSGLGLATAFSIIKRHDGHITAESKVGDGAVFHLYLPASKNPVPEKHKEAPANYKGSGKILVMDDEEPVRNLACTMLKHFGYEPLPCKDGAEAVIRYNQAKRKGEPFAAVIMDLTIPGGMGGREALQQIRAGDPSVRAIVSSGYSNDPVMAKYREFGFRGVVEKPYTIDELGRVLHDVVTSPN
jgi:PAS domain S-box-containing protein